MSEHTGTSGLPVHQPVLAREVVEQLEVVPGGVYLDATVGEGGHSFAILEASSPGGRVLGIELDPRSLGFAAQRLAGFGPRFVPMAGSYSEMTSLVAERGVTAVDGVLLDLGFSLRQIMGEDYGFGFHSGQPLDMRYDPRGTRTADLVVNTYPEKDLADLIYAYGEEPRSRSIARRIVQSRPVRSAAELAELIAGLLGPRRRGRIHPATRTFQALRIEVNGELDNLALGLPAAVSLLAPGGRLVAISYHSLEDRAVKRFISRESARCICPPQAPVCVCGHQPRLEPVRRRVIRPSPEEIESNPRSRSAKMRVARRI
jgi:16S rRNA (cytosine1402-N4)-methyltransferase